MKSKQIYFYSDGVDLTPIFKEVESNEKIHYFLTGMLDDKSFKEFSSIFDNQKFGYVSKGDWNHNDTFLLLPKNTNIIIEEIPQRKGGMKFSIDQMKNKQSIVLKLSGIFIDGILVAGSVGTISEDDFSLKMFKLFSSVIKKNFTRVGSFYVGKNALEKLSLGWRLVTNDKSPKEYDLKL